MQFHELFDMQQNLDAYIEQKQQVQKDVFQEKGLALLVELAELANETRCFKYWSSKGASKREVLLEEFVDSIHFMLSLGNMKGYRLENWPAEEGEADLTVLFIEATARISQFIAEPTKQHYVAIWQVYAQLAYNLHFSVTDVLKAYVEKNEKNYERQKSGY